MGRGAEDSEDPEGLLLDGTSIRARGGVIVRVGDMVCVGEEGLLFFCSSC